MLKSRPVTLRISESDFKKIEGMREGRTVTQFFRDLVKGAVEKEREEATSFIKLMEKIDTSDISKISEKLNEVLKEIEQIKEQNTQMRKQNTEVNFDGVMEVLEKKDNEVLKKIEEIRKQNTRINFDKLKEVLLSLNATGNKNLKAAIEIITNQKGENYAESFNAKLQRGGEKI